MKRKTEMFRRINVGGGQGKPVTLSIDGVSVAAEEGEPVAAILLRTPPFTCRRTPVGGMARAPFCMMGACFECLVEIDGETSMRSCMRPAREGMAVVRQLGRPDLLAELNR